MRGAVNASGPGDHAERARWAHRGCIALIRLRPRQQDFGLTRLFSLVNAPVLPSSEIAEFAGRYDHPVPLGCGGDQRIDGG